MMREMRRKDRAMKASHIEDVLNRAEYGVLASVGNGNYPYAIPYSYALMDGNIYIHCTSDASHSRENMTNNPTVCFTVVGDTEVLPAKFGTCYESVVIFGRVCEVTEPVLKKCALRSLLEKYSHDHIERGQKYLEAKCDAVSVMEITPIKVTGKTRPKATR